eukprot:CAMPEP_0180667854 /NCGR_PEP_ID=MMETSP1037_2-20121125/62606_1 /TAXON_ID=632150 /ORGANISM="Azadinium spinosum, Strain 3D9" /LENGTH=85 /DNA_ID=CAMNT_0022696529 /DNA_START=20 /DNA_END=278 /DNA_ORIENTATION=-
MAQSLIISVDVALSMTHSLSTFTRMLPPGPASMASLCIMLPSAKDSRAIVQSGNPPAGCHWSSHPIGDPAWARLACKNHGLPLAS